MHSFVPVEWKAEEYVLGIRANFFSSRPLSPRCGSYFFFAAQLLSLRRCSYRFFAAQRTHGKKFMPARFAPQRRNTKQPSEESHHARHVLRGNAL